MQSVIKTKSFPVRRFIVASLMLVIGAVLWLTTSMARAQLVAVDGNSGSASAVKSVVSKTAGEAQVTITGVALKPTLSYCLIGVGRGNWHGTAAKVLIEKIGCAKPEGGQVIVPIRLDAKRYEAGGSVIGYVPIAVDAAGFVDKDWPAKPAGSVDFVRSNGQPDQAIPIRWTTDGKAVLMTAAEATNLLSD